MRKFDSICVAGSANVDLTFCAPRLSTTLTGHALHVAIEGQGRQSGSRGGKIGR
jgi:hypothetical protein